MTRRNLLKLLLASPIAATLDVEKMLWVPRPIVTVPERFVTGILRSEPMVIPVYFDYRIMGDFEVSMWNDEVRRFVRGVR